MIYGLGTDIVSLSRFKSILLKHEFKFIHRFLHPLEIIKYNNISDSKKLSYIASRWAVKEATLKAYGSRLLFTDILTLSTDLNPKPNLVICNNAAKLMISKNIDKAHLSISHENEYAIATVILEQNTNIQLYENLNMYNIKNI